MSQDDKDILLYHATAFANGEVKGYDYIFRRYFKKLRVFAQNILPCQFDADDLVQDCFVRLWEKRAMLHSPSQIEGFLFTTVRNACYSILRKNQVGHIDLDRIDISSEGSDSIEHSIIKAEMLSQLFSELDHLPERMGQVCKLYFIEGKDDREIARQFNTVAGTVRNQRHRAIRAIREKLKLS
ncbi:MAG: sigma-70 family RNA polymerase sigma factor [Chitinophagaceae bacterium]